MNDTFYFFYVKIVISAAAFVGLISAGIYAATRQTRLVRQYCAAHLIALVLGAAVDVAIVTYFIPRGGLQPQYMNAVLLAPIVFFIGFSIYLCHRDTVMHLADVLIPMAPVLAWGVLVVFGWQKGMGDYDVLGAWFVSAGCGGVDLAAKFGPRLLADRPLRTRFAGYLLMLVAVYVLLPLATA